MLNLFNGRLTNDESTPDFPMMWENSGEKRTDRLLSAVFVSLK